jgi:hypothetical protein
LPAPRHFLAATALVSGIDTPKPRASAFCLLGIYVVNACRQK